MWNINLPDAKDNYALSYIENGIFFARDLFQNYNIYINTYSIYRELITLELKSTKDCKAISYGGVADLSYTMNSINL